MERTQRQLLLTGLSDPVVLPPEVKAKVAQATGALLLQILRAERAAVRNTEGDRKEGHDDQRP